MHKHARGPEYLDAGACSPAVTDPNTAGMLPDRQRRTASTLSRKDMDTQ